MLEVKNVKKSFGEKLAVNDVSFAVEDGEILALLGQNGAGKTTMFRMILGVLTPDFGKITYNNEIIDVNNSSKIGFLPEERSLLQKITIKEQLSFFAELKGMKKKEINTKIDYWLEYFDLLEYRDKKMKELSKGNQQKIQFISSFIHEPNLLILDEPFSGLDPFNIKLFKDVILELQNKGTAIIFSSHRLDYVESFSKNIIVLIEGEARIDGNIQEIKRKSNTFKIKVEGTIDKEVISELDYVLNITFEDPFNIITIKDYNNVSKLFNVIKKSEDITLYDVMLPSLEDILISEVGEKNEQ